jgi:hypothetical protein
MEKGWTILCELLDSKGTTMKNFIFLHIQIILYDLNHYFLTLIIEMILLEKIHNWPAHCVDLLKRIQMNFGLYFSEF